MNNLVKDEGDEKDRIEDEVDEDSIGAALFEDDSERFRTFCDQLSEFQDKIAKILEEEVIDIEVEERKK